MPSIFNRRGMMKLGPKDEKFYHKPEGKRLWVVRVYTVRGTVVQHCVPAYNSDEAIMKFMALEPKEIPNGEVWVKPLRDAEAAGWMGTGKR